jgi:hypothetical protein
MLCLTLNMFQEIRSQHREGEREREREREREKRERQERESQQALVVTPITVLLIKKTTHFFHFS